MTTRIEFVLGQARSIEDQISEDLETGLITKEIAEMRKGRLWNTVLNGIYGHDDNRVINIYYQ